MRRSYVLGSVLLALCAGCGSDESVASGSGGAGASGGSGEDSSAGSAGVSGAGGGAGAACVVTDAAEIAVAEIDLEGYPPYAIDACRLAYVSAASGALVLRDLTTGEEEVLATADESPRRPTLAGDVLAWQAEQASESVVRISFAGSVRTVTGAFDHAGEPRAAGDAVVFTGWLGPNDDADTDVFLAPAGSGAAQLVFGGAGQQRFADLSSSHVALSDFSEDPTGVYRGDGTALADLVVVERSSGTARAKKEPGKQAFPMLGSAGRIVYLEWLGVHPVPKFQEYTLRVADLAALDAVPITVSQVRSNRPTVRPVTRNHLVEWVERPIDAGSLLHRAELDGVQAPVTVSGLEGLELFAPAASSAITVIAVRPLAGGAPTLRAFER
jgi:hypothetical protein